MDQHVWVLVVSAIHSCARFSLRFDVGLMLDELASRLKPIPQCEQTKLEEDVCYVARALCSNQQSKARHLDLRLLFC
jgi:hypothetical protein